MSDENGLAFIGRFAHPDRTEPVSLGACRCPGSPHDQDTAEVRTEIGDGELRTAANRGGFSNGPLWDAASSDNQTVATFTTAWTLLDDDSEPVPISARMIGLLDEDTRLPLLAAVNRAAGGSLMISKAHVVEMIELLTEGDVVPASKLLASIGIAIATRRTLPNGSSARSRGSSRASASRNRSKPRR